MPGFLGAKIMDKHKKTIAYRCDRPECIYHKHTYNKSYNKYTLTRSVESGYKIHGK